jgi:hypothetical protein
LTKTLIGLVAAVLVVAVVLTLYATGPTWKATDKTCRTAFAAPSIAAKACTFRSDGTPVAVKRTNAWQRFKGAITGNP